MEVSHPLIVTKVHIEVSRLHDQGYTIVMIGHKGHPEVEGTMGQARGAMYLVEDVADVAALPVSADAAIAYVTQTTLSVDDAQTIVEALRARYPAIVGPKKDDICYATQNRQDAVKVMAPQVDVVIVVGSVTSSNSNRLRELAEKLGVPAYLVDDAQGIDTRWLRGKTHIGVTAGASAPEVLVAGVISRLQELDSGVVVALDGVPEKVNFPVPKELQY